VTLGNRLVQRPLGEDSMVEDRRPPTDEEVSAIRKLESIFLPHSHAQREWKRTSDNPGEPESPANFGWFSHYTSADAALKIIKTKRLWMRSTKCMGDYREVSHGYDLLFKYFQVEGKRAAFFAAMDVVRPGTALEVFKLFDEQWWEKIRLNTYIASLSEHDIAKENEFGRLSMWRAFGAGQPRVSLVFKVPWQSQATLALSAMFVPVAYLSEADAHLGLDNCVANVVKDADWIRSIPPEQFKGFIF
jgi:hypothetical protein